jgi:hypothetical protein
MEDRFDGGTQVGIKSDKKANGRSVRRPRIGAGMMLYLNNERKKRIFPDRDASHRKGDRE